MGTEIYINNIKCTLVNCPNCGQGYDSPFYNIVKEKLCKCGQKFCYLITKTENTKIEVKKIRVQNDQQ